MQVKQNDAFEAIETLALFFFTTDYAGAVQVERQFSHTLLGFAPKLFIRHFSRMVSWFA